MNKNLILGLAVILLFGFLYVEQNAFAGFETYTVNGSGDTTRKDTFGLDEIPFLYMKLPQAGLNFSSSFWHAPSGGDSFVSEGPDSKTERWLSLTDWTSIKEVGKWSIDSNVFYSNGTTATSFASCSVTPEPLAMILFLIGGLPLAFNLVRKRRQSLKV
ncbi:MAG: PEP-CTERM sorting domain-containing protein [Candidatus Omnitrophica bacterium]|nr:PEP-CTERM sorting domain-containing protein [Candidatus Omnitrophota bacterium]MBU4477890.1 PEP-CTERM sorting domain-containing protein [Candidatus Omnitrophota bacterium]MCG2704214.1 PEP-CTERM sorting domain-containing protein [Candidatus Omnitrophota bacterium]